MIRAKVLPVCLLCLLAPSRAHSQSRELHGTVRETGSQLGIPNATIRAIGARPIACTDEHGEFRLSIPLGMVQIHARAAGVDSKYFVVQQTDRIVDLTLQRVPPTSIPEDSGPAIVVDGVLNALGVPSSKRDEPEPVILVDGNFVAFPGHCLPYP